MSPDKDDSDRAPRGPVPAALPENEAARLAALYDTGVLDSEPEAVYDQLTRLAAAVLDVPIALVSLVDRDRQWFKSEVGLGVQQTPRDLAFCAHALLDAGSVLVVPDATADPRFASNPLVTAEPGIRYYAGAPITTPDGHALGTLCVIDRRPRRPSPRQIDALRSLAGIAAELLHARRQRTRLIESEKRFRVVFQQSHAGIAMATLDGRFVTVNDRFCEITGRSREELTSSRIFEITHPDDVPRNRELFRELLDTGTAFTYEKRYLRPDGSAVPVRTQISCIFDDEGRIQGTLGTIEDVSAQRALEGRMRESEERFIGMAQNAPLKMWITDARGDCTFINREWCTYVGADMASQLGMGRMRAIHPNEAAAVEAAFISASRAQRPYQHEYRLRRHDGAYRWHVDSGLPRFGELGEFLGFTGSVVDVHEQRMATAELEQQVAERTATLSAVLDSMPSAVVVADLNNRILVNNRAAQEISGMRSADFPADPRDWPAAYGLRALDGRVLDISEVPFGRALRGETVLYGEALIRNERRPRGTVVESSAMPLRDAQGRQFGAVVVFTDIDERKRASEALAASEAKLRLSFSQAPLFQGIFETDGRLREGNDLAFGATGWSREEHIGRYAWDCGWWKATPETRAFARRAMTTAAAGVAFREEGDYFAASGERRHEELAVSPMRDEQGRIVALFASGVDITDRRRAEAEAQRAQAALRDSEARFRLMTDVAPQILWTAAPTGEIEFVNNSGIAYFGLPEAVLLGSGWAAAIHPDDSRATLERWSRSLASGEPLDVQYRARRHDGEYRWQLARGVAQLDAQGRPQRWFGVTADVEDLKRAQQQAEAATRAKSAFLSSMSHEIRTPMNAVIGMTSLLMDMALTPEQRDAANIIRSSGEHLLTVINDILDYSKIEAGRMELERTPFALRDCVESALDLIAAEATSRGVEIGYLMQAGTPEGLLGDPGRLRQVLVNLLSNAVKFTPGRGEVAVEVTARAAANGNHEVEVSVRDSGIGMDEATVRTLFTPFMQADVSTTRVYGGTGLGLSISRRLVELMGGSISVRSAPGAGSTFTFSFIAAPAAIEQRLSPLNVVPALNGRRVLIVDDLEINRRILSHYTHLWGMVAQHTASAEEALGWLERGDPFDLALLDYHMPGMNGLHLAAAARRLRNEQQLPIIVLSSVTPEAGAGSAACALLLKPIKPSRLLETISQLFLARGRVDHLEPARYELPRQLADEHPLRILLVEDNAVNQKVAQLMFRRMGYEADVAANGLEALAAVGRQPYDLLFMDVQMPVMDGITATREICRLHDRSRRPRIVGLSANVMEQERQQGLRAGMDDYLPKPLPAEALVAVLLRTSRREAESIDDFSRAGLDHMRRVYEPEGTAQLIAELLRDLEHQRSEIEGGIAARDASRLGRAAHVIKSCAWMVGSRGLGALSERIQQLCASGTLELAVPLAAELLRRYERMLERLSSEATALPGSTP